MANILIVEDDHTLNKGIQIALKKDGHEAVGAYSFFEGVEFLVKMQFDLFLLDINLPDGNGIAFCKKLREKSSSPVLFLTANDTEEEMLKGYEAGCDDYIAKPFSIAVLRKKIQVLLKRVNSEQKKNSILQFGDLEIDREQMIVKKSGEEVHLTGKEYSLLEYLALRQGKVLTRKVLLEQVWDVDNNFIDENTLSVHVRRLRQKLEKDPKNPVYIVTVFGIGYIFGKELP